MVLYVCKRCKKEFSKKYDFDNHKNRKIPCKRNEALKKKKKLFDCDYCSKKFTRQYILNRHTQNIHADIIQNIKTNGDDNTTLNHCKQRDVIIKNKNVRNTHNGDKIKNIHNGDNVNNIHYENVYNNYNIVPFGKDGIDCLTLKEHFEILNNKKNPLEAIVLSVNLNEKRPDHHNISVSSLGKSYGQIYDGKKWDYESINLIIDTIVTSKEKDLNNIYENIKEFINEDYDKIFSNKLDECRKIRSDEKKLKMMSHHLKLLLRNNNHLVKDTQKGIIHSELPDMTDKDFDITEHEETLKDDITTQILIQLFIEKQRNRKVQIDVANAVLNFLIENQNITQVDKECVREMIMQTYDADRIKKIISIVLKRSYAGETINTDILKNDLKQSYEIDQFIENDIMKSKRNDNIDDDDVIDI